MSLLLLVPRQRTPFHIWNKNNPQTYFCTCYGSYLFKVCLSANTSNYLQHVSGNLQCVIEIRVVERFGLEGTFKDHLVQPPCHAQGHLSVDQIAQRPVQPCFEHFQWWGIHKPVPVSHHPCGEKCLAYVQCKFTLFQFKTVASSPITAGLGKRSLSYKPLLNTGRLY